MVPEGRQFFAAEFSGVGTVWLAHIIADTYSMEYIVYSRTIRQRLAVPIHKICRGCSVSS